MTSLLMVPPWCISFYIPVISLHTFLKTFTMQREDGDIICYTFLTLSNVTNSSKVRKHTFELLTREMENNL